MIGMLLRTLLSRFLLFVLFAVFIIPILLIMAIPTRWRLDSKPVFKFIDLFYRLTLKTILMPIVIKGKENIPKGPAIFLSNHQSSLDIPLVGSLADGYPHIWLARSELMQTWLLRWILPRFSIVADVTSPRKAMRSLLQVLQAISGKKRHVMIFPEGSRFSDDEVHEFFGGFVILAKKTGRPVIPIRIFNANKVYPPNSFLVHWHQITVVIGKPFIYQEGEKGEIFKQRVYSWFVEQTEE